VAGIGRRPTGADDQRRDVLGASRPDQDLDEGTFDGAHGQPDCPRGALGDAGRDTAAGAFGLNDVNRVHPRVHEGGERFRR
jgi:hypothetical protein